MLEKVVEEISFTAPEKSGETFEIDAAYVRQKTADFLKANDLKKYVL